MTGAVTPLESVAKESKTVQSVADTTTVSPLDTMLTIYEDSLASPLPTIDIRKTLLAKLCGRKHDLAFHATIITLTRRAEPFVYVITVLFFCSSLSLFFFEDLQMRTLATLVCLTCGLIFFLHAAASLLWDVLYLVVKTFDFWFLFGMNVVNTVLWCMLFHDIRAAALLVIGLLLTLATTVDANVYTRRLLVSHYVLGPPAVLTALVLVFAQFPPDLHYRTFHVRGVAIDSVDLMTNANLTVVYFMLVRGFRSWPLVFSQDALKVVRCDLFLPLCRLCPRTATETRSELHVTSTVSPVTIRRMRLVHEEGGRSFDVTQFLLPRVAKLVPAFLTRKTLNCLGVTGLMCWVSALVWKVASPARGVDARGTTFTALTIVGFVATSLFVLVHTAHFQPKLVKRVLQEIGAWYLSFQISSTTACMCDASDWQPLSVLLFLIPWLWVHWTICLDAMPAPTRNRLSFSRVLIVLVTTILVLYPVVLGYYVYYSPARPFLSNRVVAEVHLGGKVMRMESFGFLASKLFMLGVWMLRSLWRELSRPSDAFKVIKLTAYYAVGDI